MLATVGLAVLLGSSWTGMVVSAALGALAGGLLLVGTSLAFGEEFFGPVSMIFSVTSEEESIALANDTSFELGSYVFTTDSEQAVRVADAIDAGMVFINGVLLDAVWIWP